jgi:SAM-dependent methyltransferase
LPAACPVCRSPDVVDIIDLGEVALFCNVQWPTRDEALRAASAPMRLVGCTACGHHFNDAFEPGRLRYAPSYDTSQHHSTTFRAYAQSLAERLVDTYDLRRKAVVDVGCGKGDLLKLICRLGENRGHGFDVSYDGETDPIDAPGVTFHTTFFDAAQANDIAPALVCCRHVLEHVAHPVSFLRGLGEALSGHADRTLYLEVPNGELQLTTGLLWDYIYEHYSYFSEASLRRALIEAGFEVLRLEPTFGNQFLSAEVRLVQGAIQAPPRTDPHAGREHMDHAAARFLRLLDHWRGWASALPQDADATVLWGAGSKGVTFVNLLGLAAPVPIDRMIDQNPNKHGRFVARTGQVIVPPESLISRPAQTVLLMNDIYREEISQWLRQNGIRAQVVSAMMAPNTEPA